MKTINKFIAEQNLIDSNASPIYFSSEDKHIEYQIVYPAGLIECFTKNGLRDYIKELNDDLKRGEKEAPDNPGLSELEEMIITYEELFELPKDSIWYMLSGPGSDKGELKSTIGFHSKYCK